MCGDARGRGAHYIEIYKHPRSICRSGIQKESLLFRIDMWFPMVFLGKIVEGSCWSGFTDPVHPAAACGTVLQNLTFFDRKGIKTLLLMKLVLDE